MVMKRKSSCISIFLVLVVTFFLTACSSAGSTYDNPVGDVVDKAVSMAQSLDENVLMVKNGSPRSHPNVTYDEAFGEFFGNPTWKYFKGTSDGPDEDGDGKPDYTKDDLDVVEFTGRCTYQDVEVKALIQFVLDKEDGTFTAEYLSMNDIPQSELLLLTLIDKAFSQYEEKHNIVNADGDPQISGEDSPKAEGKKETVSVENTETVASPDNSSIDYSGSYRNGDEAGCMTVLVYRHANDDAYDVEIGIIRLGGFDGTGYVKNDVLVFEGTDPSGSKIAGELAPSGDAYQFKFTDAYWYDGAVKTGDSYLLYKDDVSEEQVETEKETTKAEETSENDDYTDSDLTMLMLEPSDVISNYIQKNDFSSQGNTEYGQCWSNGNETVNITVSDGMIMSLSIYSGAGKSLFGVEPGVTSYQSAAEMLLDCEFVFIYDESPTWSIFRSAYDEEVWVYHKDDGIVSGIGYTPFIMGE